VRALLWKKGGTAMYVGVHEHGNVLLAFAFAAPTPRSLDAIEMAVHLPHRACATQRRGMTVVGVLQRSESLDADVAFLEALAAENDGHVALELVPLNGTLDDPSLGKALAARVNKDSGQHMFFRFGDDDGAAHFAKDVEGVVRAGHFAVISGERVGPRLGYLAARYGGSAEWFVGEMQFTATLYKQQLGRKSVDDGHMHALGTSLLAQLRALSPSAASDALSGAHSSTMTVPATNPGALLTTAVAFAKQCDTTLYAHFESSSRVPRAVQRVHGDVVLLRRS
jgi:hypothetical protein